MEVEGIGDRIYIYYVPYTLFPSKENHQLFCVSDTTRKRTDPSATIFIFAYFWRFHFLVYLWWTLWIYLTIFGFHSPQEAVDWKAIAFKVGNIFEIWQRGMMFLYTMVCSTQNYLVLRMLSSSIAMHLCSNVALISIVQCCKRLRFTIKITIKRMFCVILEVFTQLSFFPQKTTIQILIRWLIVSSKVSLYRKSGRAPPVSIKYFQSF